MAAILNSAILNLAILDSAILVFPLKLTHTCQDWFPPFAEKKLHSHFPPHHLHKKTSLIHSDSTWWWQPSWILPCWIKKLHSFICTQLDDGSHLELYDVGFRHCHLGFWHLLRSSLRFTQKHCSHLLRSDSHHLHKKTFTHSTKFDEGNLNSHVGLRKLHSFILTQLDDDSHLEFYHVGLKKLRSFILTQLDDGSHLEFCHLGFRHLVFFSQIHSKTLSLHCDSDSN